MKTVWDELLEGQGGEVVINVGRTYRPLWDDTVCALMACHTSSALAHAPPPDRGSTSAASSLPCPDSPTPPRGEASHALLAASQVTRLAARQTTDGWMAGARGQLASVARRFGMTPERVVQANADLIGMEPAHLFSEFKRQVLLPFLLHALLRRAPVCPCACASACGVVGEASGTRMHAALTTGSCFLESTTQASNRTSDELCIIPDSCGLGTDQDYFP